MIIAQRDFIKRLSRRSGYTQKDIANVLDTMREEIIEIVKSNEGVKLFNGFVIEGKVIGEHAGRNPMTGETVTVPAKTRVSCKFGPGFKKALDEKK